ncbi:M23 family metallopeptidase [Bacillus alkalicellulosilyticus]|uniref:M23 family metallopeptidase n=1 Tax=Alkalihalobacterium alkalicellulosilyticum TaxID=1912214 RepID=UPI00099685FA|nr:M23 family metallopeptidase [Bacillus alkalicellulosilyticus]
MREEEKNQSSKQSSFNVQRFLRRRWILPAVYLGAAAVVLSAFFMLQNGNESALPIDELDNIEQPTDGNFQFDQEAVPVTGTAETFKLPVAEENDVDVVGHFFDYDASPEEQQEALVYYNNTYRPNTGIDLAKESGESFDVTAALSGTVVKAVKDELLGYVVEINHDNGVVTHYQSLDKINVEEGASIKQGEILGQAGRNLYNSDAGVHVHFEIRHNGVAVNPLDFMNQTLQTVVDKNTAADEDESDEKESGDKESDDKDSDKEAEDAKEEQPETIN